MGTTCKDCKYYEEDVEIIAEVGNHYTGICRKRSPFGQYGWPPVRGEKDYCGELEE